MSILKQQYNLTWLIEEYSQGLNLKYLFFWGHTNKFQEQVGKFGFSQWFELPFTVDKITYPTAEHWMMAQKALLFDDIKTYQQIINAAKPGEVKALGRQILNFNEELWNKHKYDIVVTGNIHKFNQHPAFAAYLLNTGDRILVEASPVDIIWGAGLAQDNEDINDPIQWRGQNLLGFALMQVRDFFRRFGLFSYLPSPVRLPWKINPKIDPADLYWRMGAGEDLIINLSNHYLSLSERDKVLFRLTHPAPHYWTDFYD